MWGDMDKIKKFTIYGIIKCVISTSPVYSIIIIVLKLICALIPSFNTIVVSGFIDHSIQYLKGYEQINKLIPYLILIVIFLIVSMCASVLSRMAMTKTSYDLKYSIKSATIRHKAKLEYECYEDAEKWNLLTRVGENTDERFLGIFQNVLSILSLIVTIAGLLLILLTQVWWSAVIVLALSIILIRFSIKSGKESYTAGQEVSQLKRFATYLSEVLINRDYVLERDVFDYSPTVSQEYLDAYEIARKKEYRVKRKWFVKLKLGGVASSLLSFLIAVILIPLVLNGRLSIGLYIALISSIFNVVSLLSWQITSYMDQYANDLEFIKEYNIFLSLPEIKSPASLPSFCTGHIDIEFQDVYFRYPGQDEDVLKGISFHIENGKSYSIVGLNGAGKTTIIKLLSGLYSDYRGKIVINGRELRDYSSDEISGFCSYIYQDYCKYPLTFEENIKIGDIVGFLDDSIKLDERFHDVIKKSGLEDIEKRLPNGKATQISKLYEDGVDLSGGEWQRIAIARSLMSPAPVKVFDEPTAALDPIAESDLYHTFQRIGEGNTMLMISHRLGSTLLADVIFVLKDGKIIEKGNHSELIQTGGEYAKMFELQRSWYN